MERRKGKYAGERERERESFFNNSYFASSLLNKLSAILSVCPIKKGGKGMEVEGRGVWH